MSSPPRRRTNRNQARLAIATLAALAALPLAREAWACGGCFSPPAPQQEILQTVKQDAERVLFLRDEATKTSTVWVEVRYSGEAKQFGWVLPVPKLPKVGVGVTLLFDLLDKQTSAFFQTQYVTLENCRQPSEGCDTSSFADTTSGGMDDASASDAASFGNGPAAPGVQVLEQGQTGPYDYAIVQGQDAKPLQAWLTQNGYATPAKAAPILDSHIKKGDLFVAIKLQNGQGVDAIRPVTLEMQDAEPCVPLRLTSIAAQEDMTVVVTLGGNGRAVPKNFLHVVVNPARIDWQNGGGNHAQVLAAAIDEAGGHAFATDSVRTGKELGDVSTFVTLAAPQVASVKDLLALTQVLAQWALHVSPETAALVDQFGGLSKHWPNVAPLQMVANLRSCGLWWQSGGADAMGPFNTQDQPCMLPGVNLLTKDLAKLPIDGAALHKAIHDEIGKPLAKAGKLLAASAKVTRLTTRISPDEMDRDPVFGFHPGLPDVQQTRTAKVGQVCSTGWFPADRTRIILPDLGSWVVQGLATTDPRFQKAPLALRVELLDETGGSVVLNAADIDLVDTAIQGAVPGKPSLPPGLTLKPPVPWQPPPSDASVTALGPWQSPGPWCVPKPGWVSGKLPPTGTQVDPQDAATAVEVVGPDGGVSAKDSQPAVDAGGTDVTPRPLQDSGPERTAKAPPPAANDDGGCHATGHGGGAGWFGLLLAALGLAWRRRTAN